MPHKTMTLQRFILHLSPSKFCEYLLLLKTLECRTLHGVVVTAAASGMGALVVPSLSPASKDISYMSSPTSFPYFSIFQPGGPRCILSLLKCLFKKTMVFSISILVSPGEIVTWSALVQAWTGSQEETWQAGGFGLLTMNNFRGKQMLAAAQCKRGRATRMGLNLEEAEHTE